MDKLWVMDTTFLVFTPLPMSPLYNIIHCNPDMGHCRQHETNTYPFNEIADLLFAMGHKIKHCCKAFELIRETRALINGIERVFTGITKNFHIDIDSQIFQFVVSFAKTKENSISII